MHLRSWSKTGFISSYEDKLTLQAELELPQVLSIQFTTKYSVDTNAYPIILDADIYFSTEGNSSHRRVTVFDGVTVSGVADTFKIVVSCQAPFIPPFFPIPTFTEQLPVSVLVGPGSRAVTGQPPILVTQNYSPPASDPAAPGSWTVPAHNSKGIDIPLDAGVQSVFVYMIRLSNLGGFAVNAPGEIVMVQSVTKLATYDLARCYPDFNKWIPIIPGVDKLVFYNLDTTDNWIVRPVWGVDG